jgi:hypothetical protein
MLYGTNAIAEFHVCRVPEADVAIVLHIAIYADMQLITVPNMCLEF